jgi:hypothetical protein
VNNNFVILIKVAMHIIFATHAAIWQLKLATHFSLLNVSLYNIRALSNDHLQLLNNIFNFLPRLVGEVRQHPLQMRRCL